MNIEKLNELYFNEKKSGSNYTNYYILTDTENPDKLKREYFTDYHKKNHITPHTFYPAMVVFSRWGNYQDKLIIFGIASKEMGFTPAPIKIGKINLSYYKLDNSINNQFKIETDITLNENIDIDISTLTQLNYNIHHGHNCPSTRLINLLICLNWCYPYFDAIEKANFVNLVSNDYWFYNDKLKVYLEAIKDLDCAHSWSTRYKPGEGTLDDFYYKIILNDNNYVSYLIKEVVSVEQRESDVMRQLYNQKFIDEMKFMHINKARLLAFENFKVSKYFLSLVRDYDKYPFGSIPIDI
jgi:hypothetical protein